MVDCCNIAQKIARRPLPNIRLRVEWKGVFENWAKRYVSRNYWKVQEHLASHEDAVAECALIFTRCLRTYEYKVDNAAWFMSLFQRAVANEFITYAQKATHTRNTVMYARDDDDVLARENVPCADSNMGFLAAVTSTASSELRTVLALIARAPAEMLELLLEAKDEKRLNARWLRLSGIKHEVNVVAELRSLLT